MLLLEITEDEAREGTLKVVEIIIPTDCSQCRGLGYTNQTKSQCPVCLGHKKVISFNRFDRRRYICTECDEEGNVIHADECDVCAGTGKISSTRKTEIVIPPGSEDQEITSGDTVIQIKVVANRWNDMKSRLPKLPAMPKLPSMPRLPRKKK